MCLKYHKGQEYFYLLRVVVKYIIHLLHNIFFYKLYICIEVEEIVLSVESYYFMLRKDIKIIQIAYLLLLVTTNLPASS